MKTIKIHDLKLKNFCNQKEIGYHFDGKSFSVFGRNGAGKTTGIEQPIVWLLAGDLSCEIKEIAKEGVVHNLSHEAEITISVDGKQVVLKKVLSEKWSTNRGGKTPKLTGHNTTCFIDEVEKKTSKAYHEIIDSMIADEETLKLIMNPQYFISLLHWQERRNLLIEIAGGIPDQSVFDSDPKFGSLPDIIEPRSVDDHKDMTKKRISKINEKKIEIDAGIKENIRNIPDTIDLNQTEEVGKFDRLEEQIKAENGKLLQIQLGGAIAEKKNRLSEVEAKMLDMKIRHKDKIQEEIDRLQAKYNLFNRQATDLNTEKERLGALIIQRQSLINHNTNECERLREEWHENNKLKLEIEKSEFKDQAVLGTIEDNICPWCKEPLRPEKKQALIDEAMKKFNLDKSEKIEKFIKVIDEINKIGKTLKDELSEVQRFIVEDQVNFEKIVLGHEKVTTDIAKSKAFISSFQTKKDDLSDNPKYQSLSEQAETIRKQIEAIQDGQSDDSETKFIEDKISALEKERGIIQYNLDQIRRALDLQKRIDQLRAQDLDLSKECERLQFEQDLCTEFKKIKILMLENRINAKFEHVRFKMFDYQINGDEKECCIPLGQNDQGVWIPYGDLSAGQKIFTGLSATKALSAHYGIEITTIIDGAESLTLDPELSGQVIRLVVSENDETLRFVQED